MGITMIAKHEIEVRHAPTPELEAMIEPDVAEVEAAWARAWALKDLSVAEIEKLLEATHRFLERHLYAPVGSKMTPQVLAAMTDSLQILLRRLGFKEAFVRRVVVVHGPSGIAQIRGLEDIRLEDWGRTPVQSGTWWATPTATYLEEFQAKDRTEAVKVIPGPTEISVEGMRIELYRQNLMRGLGVAAGDDIPIDLVFFMPGDPPPRPITWFLDALTRLLKPILDRIPPFV